MSRSLTSKKKMAPVVASGWTSYVNLHLVGVLAFIAITQTTAPLGVAGTVYWFGRLILGWLVIVGLLGLNISVWLEARRGRVFSRLEQLTILAFSGLIAAPLLLSVEHSLLTHVPTLLPVANVVLLLFGTLSLKLLKPAYQPLSQWRLLTSNGLIDRRWPLIWLTTLAIYLSMIALMTHLYYPLPETDSYYWYTLYAPILEQGNFLTFTSSRPLFSSLAFIVNRTIGFNLYDYFKYFLPSLLLLLMLPACLMARTGASRANQLAWLFLPGITAASFNYFFIPIPQAVIAVILMCSVLLMLYSHQTNQPIFYYLAGFWLLTSYFFHELVAIIFLTWLTVTIIHNRAILTRWSKRHGLTIVLAILAILPHINLLLAPVTFVFNQFSRFAEAVGRLNTNWLFPAQYINVDGRSVGWGSLAGVAKYYLYYLGPAVAWLLACSLILLLLHPDFRSYLKKEVRRSQEIAALLTTFTVFLLISEILPRLVSFAYLPDRASSLTAIFSLVWLYLLTNFSGLAIRTRRLVCAVFVFGLATNMVGATYIEWQKRYSITVDQLNSTAWIKQHLPGNRLMITDNHYGLLRVHADSEVCGLGNMPEFYFEKSAVEKALDTCLGETIEQLERHYQENLTQARQYLDFLGQTTDFEQRTQGLSAISNNLIDLRANSLLINQKQSAATRPIYIYYSAKNDNYIYKDRPYSTNSSFEGRAFLFDQDPEHYQRVYEDEEHQIFIWLVSN